jgi:hypothetical protein
MLYDEIVPIGTQTFAVRADLGIWGDTHSIELADCRRPFRHNRPRPRTDFGGMYRVPPLGSHERDLVQ